MAEGGSALDFKWSTKEYHLPDIIINIGGKCHMPLVVKIVSVGKSLKSTFLESEIYRLDSRATQTRMVLEGQEGTAYSIPQNYPIYFRPQVHGRSNGVSVSLRELTNKPPPVSLEFDVKKSDRKDFLKYKFCNLTLVQSVNVEYVIANQLNEAGCICNEVIAISSLWDIKVKISRAKDIQLCHGCSDYLGKYLMAKKDKLNEPDFLIEELKVSKTAVNSGDKPDYEKLFALIPSAGLPSELPPTPPPRPDLDIPPLPPPRHPPYLQMREVEAPRVPPVPAPRRYVRTQSEPNLPMSTTEQGITRKDRAPTLPPRRTRNSNI